MFGFKNKFKKIKYDIDKITDESIIKSLKESENVTISDEIIINENNKENKKLLIEIKDLTKVFGHKGNKVTAINGVSLNIYQNQNIALLGGNGAGKTTFVEIISGLNKQTSGEIKYHFEDNANFKEYIGIQFQDSSYPVGIKVRQVIKFITKISKISINKDTLNAMLCIFGIDEFYNKKASSLSGGQQQRLNCLLAILNKPKFIILDELSTGLDVTIRNKIKTFIKEYAKENNITILIVSHDMDEVDYIADRIVIMKKGNIYLDMDKSDVIKKYKTLNNCISNYV